MKILKVLKHLRFEVIIIEMNRFASIRKSLGIYCNLLISIYINFFYHFIFINEMKWHNKRLQLSDCKNNSPELCLSYLYWIDMAVFLFMVNYIRFIRLAVYLFSVLANGDFYWSMNNASMNKNHKWMLPFFHPNAYTMKNIRSIKWETIKMRMNESERWIYCWTIWDLFSCWFLTFT